jgi:hypothetical protein
VTDNKYNVRYEWFSPPISSGTSEHQQQQAATCTTDSCIDASIGWAALAGISGKSLVGFVATRDIHVNEELIMPFYIDPVSGARCALAKYLP